MLAQFNHYFAWGGTKPHSVATEKSPGKCFSSSSLPEGLTTELSGQEGREAGFLFRSSAGFGGGGSYTNGVTRPSSVP